MKNRDGAGLRCRDCRRAMAPTGPR
jgi:hypothetical protein